MSDEIMKALGRTINGVMDIAGSTVQKVADYYAKPGIDKLNDAYDEKAKERERQQIDDRMKASFKELALTEALFKEQDYKLQQLREAEAFSKADLAEKEAQLKELFEKQDREKDDLFKQQELRDKTVFADLAQQRDALFAKEDLARQEAVSEIERQKDSSAKAQADLLEQRRQETEFAKPDFADVDRAEDRRRALELAELDKKHQETMASAEKAADGAIEKDRLDAQEAEKRLRELAEKQTQERRDLERQQRERLERLEKLYDHHR